MEEVLESKVIGTGVGGFLTSPDANKIGKEL